MVTLKIVIYSELKWWYDDGVPEIIVLYKNMVVLSAKSKSLLNDDEASDNISVFAQINMPLSFTGDNLVECL